ncbi:MAG: hypothetical protein ACRYFL_10675 [Janthinobacterium lividum]
MIIAAKFRAKSASIAIQINKITMLFLAGKIWGDKRSIWACPFGSGFPLQVLARASLWAFRCNPSRSKAPIGKVYRPISAIKKTTGKRSIRYLKLFAAQS